jgi:hypothetical protein
MALSGEVYSGAALAISWNANVLEQEVVRSLTINESKDVHDSTGGGGGSKTYLGGEQDATCTLELWSSDDDADVRDLFSLANDAGVAVIVYPKGNTTGEIQIDFTAIVTGITEGIEKNSVVPLTVTAQITGSISRQTVTA